MSLSSDSPQHPSGNRPAVHSLESGPHGRSFRLSFQARQALPPHLNTERVVIAAERGQGTLLVDGEPPRRLEAGIVVQLEPNARHAVTAGDGGLELVVTVAPNCCRMC